MLTCDTHIDHLDHHLNHHKEIILDECSKKSEDYTNNDHPYRGGRFNFHTDETLTLHLDLEIMQTRE